VPFSSLIVSALIIVPQVIVALMAPWVGHRDKIWGRRPLLLVGFAEQASAGSVGLNGEVIEDWADCCWCLSHLSEDGDYGAVSHRSTPFPLNKAAGRHNSLGRRERPDRETEVK
jgi:hypothetical protein